MAQATSRSDDAKNPCLKEEKQMETDTKMVKGLLPTTVNSGDMENDQSKTDLGAGKPSKIEQLEIELAKAKQKETSLENDLAKAKQNEASAVGALELLKKASASNNDQISDLERRNKAKDEELLSMARQLQESQDQYEKLSEELKIKKEESEGTKKQLVDSFTHLEDLSCRLEEAERTIESNQRQIEEKDAELQDKDRQMCLLKNPGSSLTSDMAEENNLLRRDICVLTINFEALTRRISFLEVQNEFCRQDFEEERRAKRLHERLNHVLVEKLRVGRIEREDLRRVAEEYLHEAARAQAVIADFQIMAENAQAGLQAVHPIIPDGQASASILMPDTLKKLLERLGRQNSALIQTTDALEKLISSLKDKNGADSLARSCESEVENEMDERCVEAKRNEQDSWSTAQSFPQQSEQNVNVSVSKTEVDIAIIYKDLKKKTRNEGDPCRKRKLDEMIKIICALLNTAGGAIKIDEKQNDKTTVIGDRSELFLSLEQHLVTIMGQTDYRLLIFSSWDSKREFYYIFVEKGKRVYTEDCGLKVPLSRSVVDATYECYVNIVSGRDVCKRDYSPYKYVEEEHAALSLNSTVLFEEGETIQFKEIPHGPSENLYKFFDKNLPKYVSAFANHLGGSIYFGIHDNGKVVGRLMDEHDKKKVENLINKIIDLKDNDNESVRMWRKESFIPRSGEQWAVEFLKVLGGPVNEERYVVKVTIPAFRGGMFLTKPVAWKIDKMSGNVVKMTPDEWINEHSSDDQRDYCAAERTYAANVGTSYSARSVPQSGAVAASVPDFAQNIPGSCLQNPHVSN